MIRALVLLAVLGLATPVRANPVGNTLIHRARPGDTLELLAAEYYGDRHHAVFLMVANRMPHPRKLRRGERLRIPVSRDITVSVGDTLESLAASHLGDSRRAEFLAEFNRLGIHDTLAAGSTVTIPLTVTYVAENDLSLRSVAAAYLGDGQSADLLARYNFLDKEQLTKGESIVVPIRNVRVRPGKLPGLDAESKARAEKRRSIQGQASQLLPRAYAAARQADYAAVKRDLAGVELDYLDTDVAVEIGVLLGSAYVAFGDLDSAAATFARVLERRPHHALDRYRFSPKILDAWRKAGGAIVDTP